MALARTDPSAPSHHLRRYLALGLIPLAGLLAAACGSTGTATPTTTSGTTATGPTTPPPTTSSQSTPVVTTKTVKGLGNILVNSEDQVLYSFTKNGASVPCDASCLQVWPAVTLPAGVTVPSGSAGVGTLATTTANGVTQVTVGGLPLYTYDGDPAPGVANGNNLTSFGGTWKVVKAQ
jgi:predicted lipoprotein with Yx(FWY)xxD motif